MNGLSFTGESLEKPDTGSSDESSCEAPLALEEVTIPGWDSVKRRRAELKLKARDWEKNFAAKANGAKPTANDRRQSSEYMAIRKSMRGCDAALSILNEGVVAEVLHEAKLHQLRHAFTSRAEQYLLALHAAGSLLPEGTALPYRQQRAERTPSMQSDGSNFEARLEKREARGVRGQVALAQAPSGKLLVASAPQPRDGGDSAEAVNGGGGGKAEKAAFASAAGKGASGLEEDDPDLKYAGKREYEAVTPGRFTRCIIRCPCCFAVGVMLLTLLISVAAVRIGGMPELVQRSGWQSDASPIMHAMRAASTVRSERVSLATAAAAQAEAEAAEEAEAEKRKPLSAQFSSSMLLYNAHNGGSVITADGVASMISFETKLLEQSGYGDKHCKRVYSSVDEDKWRCGSPTTLLATLHLDPTQHQAQCEQGYCAAPASMLGLCTAGIIEWGVPPCTSLAFDWREGVLAPEEDWASLLSERLCGPAPFARQLLLEADARCDADGADLSTIQYVRSIIPLGWPLLDFVGTSAIGNSTDWNAQWKHLTGSDFSKELKATLKGAQDELSATPAAARSYATTGDAKAGKPLSITWLSDATGGINDYITADIMLALASFTFVFTYVAFNLKSLFLAVCGMFEIVISLPLAYFVWSVVMGQSRISWLQILSIYILLCVGADDLFVFYDTWRQSRELPRAISGSIEMRFAWTFNRAALAMLTTTTTTAICLGATAASPMGQMQAFGLFTALAIIVDCASSHPPLHRSAHKQGALLPHP